MALGRREVSCARAADCLFDCLWRYLNGVTVHDDRLINDNIEYLNLNNLDVNNFDLDVLG